MSDGDVLQRGLHDTDIQRSAAALSCDGVFFFTIGNLFFELQRRGLVRPGLGNDPQQTLRRFEQEIDARTAAHPIPQLLRPERSRDALPPTQDALQYAVRRVVVCDSLDMLWLLAANRFHLEIEVGFVTADGYPAHVDKRITEQVTAGFHTTFLLLHDCNQRAVALRSEWAERFTGDACRIRDVGMRFNQVFNLGLTVHAAGERLLDADDRRPTELLLSQGCHAYLEEMPPLRLLQWLYKRIARREEHVGFG